MPLLIFATQMSPSGPPGPGTDFP